MSLVVVYWSPADNLFRQIASEILRGLRDILWHFYWLYPHRRYIKTRVGSSIQKSQIGFDIVKHGFFWSGLGRF